jgi:beta-lactam-binding protein with PASTA domain
LVFCFPLGLVGLWLRRGTSNAAKVIVTIVTVAFVIIVLVTSPPDEGTRTTPSTPVKSPPSSSSSASQTAAVATVPALEGISMSQARHKLRAAGLVVGRITREPSRARPGTVLTQTLKNGAKVNPGTKVPVTVAAPLPRIPAVKGLTMMQARHELRAAGLVVGRITREPSRARPGTVLAQSLTNGAKVTPGTKVPITIAVPLPRIPAVVGQTATSAATELRRAGYAVKRTYRTQTSGRAGVVLSQSPSSGVPSKKGTSVVVFVRKVVSPPPPKPQRRSCTPGYSPCLPPAYDYDCAGGSGDGPKYATGPVRVTGRDPYDLERDGDGVACED